MGTAGIHSAHIQSSRRKVPERTLRLLYSCGWKGSRLSGPRLLGDNREEMIESLFRLADAVMHNTSVLV